MMDFPRRMRDWLFNIMRDMADRQELSPHYLKLEKEAETNLTRRWSNAAIWKWCDLDGHPHDRLIFISYSNNNFDKNDSTDFLKENCIRILNGSIFTVLM